MSLLIKKDFPISPIHLCAEGFCWGQEGKPQPIALQGFPSPQLPFKEGS